MKKKVGIIVYLSSILLMSSMAIAADRCKYSTYTKTSEVFHSGYYTDQWWKAPSGECDRLHGNATRRYCKKLASKYEYDCWQSTKGYKETNIGGSYREYSSQPCYGCYR